VFLKGYLGELDKLLNKRLVHILVDIDALDGAAALARVEERAIDQLVNSVVEVAVGANIGGVLAAELEASSCTKVQIIA